MLRKAGLILSEEKFVIQCESCRPDRVTLENGMPLCKRPDRVTLDPDAIAGMGQFAKDFLVRETQFSQASARHHPTNPTSSRFRRLVGTGNNDFQSPGKSPGLRLSAPKSNT